MVAVALVAGYATRLYPLTENMPKALLVIGGESLLMHVVKKIEKIEEVNKLVLISNAKFYKNFIAWKEKYEGRLEVVVIDDGTTSNDNRLGAIGDIQFVIENLHLDDDMLVTVTDNLYEFDFDDYYSFYKGKDAPCILGCEFDDLTYLINNFAVVKMDEHHKVTEMIEKPRRDVGSSFGAYAVYFYPKRTIPLFKSYLDEGNNKDAPGNFPAWLCERMPVYAYDFGKGKKCYDIGTIEVYNKMKNG